MGSTPKAIQNSENDRILEIARYLLNLRMSPPSYVIPARCKPYLSLCFSNFPPTLQHKHVRMHAPITHGPGT